VRDEALVGRKVLLVDDDRAALRLVRDVLAPGGFVFAEANDGRAALAAIRDFRPDVCLLDVELPGLSGIEVCRIVKAHDGKAFGFLPVILLTASGGAGKVEGLEAGADDWIAKPAEPLELKARVKSALRLKRLHDELLAKMAELDRANRELLERKRELEGLSRTDPLTGLFNRRYFEERYAGEFERSRRYRSALACLMIDIDHFKGLNDGHGHAFGDEVLRDVAATIRRTLRDVDLVARYGGEEFVALLPETGLEDGRRAAERVREAVAAREYLAPGDRRVTITASFGVAAHPAPGIASREDLLRAADEALYRAKAGGRNRVVGDEP
jgi:diguanylate cyclase (GGDEF)-like protein